MRPCSAHRARRAVMAAAAARTAAGPDGGRIATSHAAGVTGQFTFGDFTVTS